MPLTVRDLVTGKAAPTTIGIAERASTALQLMIENDYSQLPVVDRDQKPLGMVSAESILRAVNAFGLAAQKLRVSDALVSKPKVYGADESLEDLLDELRDEYAVLIVDGDNRLTGIITSYDTTEYLRRSAEDMMVIGDIENLLKDYIRTCFTARQGEPDPPELVAAIADVVVDRELEKRFRKALGRYVAATSKNTPINKDEASRAFSSEFDAPPKALDQLTIHSYVALFLHESRWGKLGPLLGLEAASIRALLHRVRDTRNALAHFRGDITSSQRDELRFCYDWLRMLRQAIQEAFPPPPTPVQEAGSESSPTVAPVDGSGPVPLDEPIAAADSRYAPIAVWLQGIPPNQAEVQTSFSAIEDLIHGKLPASARRHPSWWANDMTSHAQSKQWTSAGWVVSSVDLDQERVLFRRTEERVRDYEHFFDTLLRMLGGTIPFSSVRTSKTTKRVRAIMGVRPSMQQPGGVSFGFSRDGRYRVAFLESVPGTTEKLRALQESIAAATGAAPELQRDAVVFSREATIESSEAELAQLQTWTVDLCKRMVAWLDQTINGAPAVTG